MSRTQNQPAESSPDYAGERSQDPSQVGSMKKKAEQYEASAIGTTTPIHTRRRIAIVYRTSDTIDVLLPMDHAHTDA